MSSKTLSIELHCHTVHSMDGLMTFESLIHTARLIGLDAVAITDHDTVEGAMEFQRRAKEQQLPLQIIVGEERTLEDGSHFIGLFLQKHIAAADLAGAIREIENQGGLCLVPHPFRRKDGLFRDEPERIKLFQNRLAGFEIFNAKCGHAENQRARLLLNSALAPFGGSDAHYECDLGECINVIQNYGDLRTSIEAMLRRRAPYQLLGKTQRAGDGERAYAPLYHRFRKVISLPRAMKPMAKAMYQRYRNWKHGVGPKPLIEVYRHA